METDDDVQIVGRPVSGYVSRVKDPPPFRDFDPAPDADERARFGRQVAEFVALPIIGGDHPQVIAMLATDWFGYWMTDIGDQVTIAVKLPEGEPLIVRLTRSDTSPGEKFTADRNQVCSLGYSDPGAEIALSAINGCEYFYWGTTGDPVGYDVERLWPPRSRVCAAWAS